MKKSRSGERPNPLIGGRSNLYSGAIIILDFRWASPCRRQMVDADEHHVLDAVEVLVERGIDLLHLKRVVDVNTAAVFSSQFGD